MKILNKKAFISGGQKPKDVITAIQIACAAFMLGSIIAGFFALGSTVVFGVKRAFCAGASVGSLAYTLTH